ncbi:MAG: aminopeptidase N [Micrococcales bacterium]
MSGENLTRIEAEERSALIEVSNYRVELDLSGSDTETYWSGTRVSFTANRVGAGTFIDAMAHSLTRVTLNGVDLNPAEVYDGYRITLSNLQASNELVVEGLFKYTNTGIGLHRFVDPVDGNVYLYSHFEPADSRLMFAVFEQPDLKAIFDFVVTAPEAWTVIGNQPVRETALVGDGKRKWQFESTPRISSYITAIVAGPYHGVHGSLTTMNGRVVPMGVYCRQSLAAHVEAEYMMDVTAKGVAFYESKFGVEFPFDKYDQIYTPEYNMGAMENAGCVTYNEKYIFRSQQPIALHERRAITILHELAHMWFGNLVTMRWWNDLWLNESFAEYISEWCTAEVTEFKDAWTTFCAQEKLWAYTEDQLPTTHPIVDPINNLKDVEANFDAITYAKGASALQQLVAFVGQDKFVAGVGNYFRKHAWGNTVLQDLLSELEAASGRSLSGWAEQWLETAGVNTLSPALTTDGDGKILGFAITQGAAADYPTIRAHHIRVGFYNLIDGRVVRTNQFEAEIDSAVAQVPEAVGHQRPDFILLNDDDLSYAKVRLDKTSYAFALENLSKFEDSLARAQVWVAVWNAAHDALVAPSDFINLVLDHIATEDQSMLVTTMFNQLRHFAQYYLVPKGRNERIVEVAARLWILAEKAEAGSDMQLQLVLNFARLARSAEQAEILRGLHDGSRKLAGLELSADLKWELLAGLATNNAVDSAAIDAELALDNTANGLAGAAAARGALGNLEAKKAVWHRLVHTKDWSNAEVMAAAYAFNRTTSPAMLDSFVEQYFNDVKYVFENKTYKMAEYILFGLYPFALANRDLANQTKRWLERNAKADHTLRRLIKENLGILERAIAAQAMDKHGSDS